MKTHQHRVVDPVVAEEIPAGVLFAQGAGVAQSAGSGCALAIGTVDRGLDLVFGLRSYRALGIGAQQHDFTHSRGQSAFGHRNISGTDPAGLRGCTHLATELA